MSPPEPPPTVTDRLPFSPPPRERVEVLYDRLRQLGGDALSAAELLWVVAGSPAGPPGLLERFGSLRRLAQARAGELASRGGLAETDALRVAAAFALGRAVETSPLARGQSLRSPTELWAAFGTRLQDLKKERFVSLLLDGRHRLLREEVVSEGTLTASLVHPREVFGPAVREAAAAVVLLHNHPSGDPEPSPEDVEITRRLLAAGELLGIRVLDHVVVAADGYVSLRDRGLVPP